MADTDILSVDETEESYASNDAVILNYSQTPVKYEAVPKVWLTHPESTENAPVLVPFTYGELLKDVQIEPDFSAGDQKIFVPDGSLVKEATIIKPEDLTPENIRKGVTIGGIEGEFLGDTEEIEVELDMADGDQVILPAEEGKSFSKVTVKKPETLVPENIAKDVNIGGVVGTHEGGGATLPYIEYTLNDAGEPIAAKMYGYTSIPTGCFAYMASLKSVDLTESPNITSIGGSAFRGCSAITQLTIPDSVKNIGDYAFYDCTILTSITIPDSVTSIGTSAFSVCKALTSITIPDGVTSIQNSTFNGCTGLKSITIPDSVTTINYGGFMGCTALTSVTIGNNVTTIGDSAFNYCKALTSITIPASVTRIGNSAFYNCAALTSATFKITSGWWRSSSSTATSGTSIPSSNLANKSTAAKYLRDTYKAYYWNRR